MTETVQTSEFSPSQALANAETAAEQLGISCMVSDGSRPNGLADDEPISGYVESTLGGNTAGSSRDVIFDVGDGRRAKISIPVSPDGNGDYVRLVDHALARRSMLGRSGRYEWVACTQNDFSVEAIKTMVRQQVNPPRGAVLGTLLVNPRMLPAVLRHVRRTKV